jgi:hypothetical protein
LMVIREELLEQHPNLGPDIFNAFVQAKKIYVDRLGNGQIARPTAVDEMYKRVMDLTGKDPLPYGVGPNLATLEEIILNASQQKILTRPVNVEQLFPRNMLDLVG